MGLFTGLIVNREKLSRCCCFLYRTQRNTNRTAIVETKALQAISENARSVEPITSDGTDVGVIVDGVFVGDSVGVSVGFLVGDSVGDIDGLSVGEFEGEKEGSTVGVEVGFTVGSAVGRVVLNVVASATHSSPVRKMKPLKQHVVVIVPAKGMSTLNSSGFP